MGGHAAPSANRALQPLVVVAHSDRDTRGLACRLLRESEHQVIAVADSMSVITLLEAGLKLDAVALGVALGNPPFYSVCESIRSTLPDCRTLIISSTYSATAYKRAPTDLYGAHDVVEEHRLSAELVQRVGALLEG